MAAAPTAERRALIPRRVDPGTLTGARLPHPVARCGGDTMGTHWRASLVLPPADLAEAEAAIREVFERFIRQMSPWREDSELSRYNHAQAGSWQRLSPEFFEVLSRALEVARETGGAYSPALGRAVDLLGFGPRERGDQAVDDIALHRAMAAAQGARIELDATERSAFQPGGVHLDLNSIAKGFAVDRAGEALEGLGCTNYLVEIGGEVRARGCKPGGQPWWCELELPAGSAVEPTVLALCDSSLAGSGGGVRRRWLRGRWCGHILDGRAGVLLPSPLAGVFVVQPECGLADVYATALYALGPDAGVAFAEERGLAALFVFEEASALSEYQTSAFRQLLD